MVANVVLSTLTKAKAKELAQKTARNLDRRAERLAKRNLISEAIIEVKDLKESVAKAKTRNDWVKVAGKALQLDNSPLMRVATAPAEIKKRREKAARAAERARKDDLVARASSTWSSRYMSEDELIEANKILRARVQGRANATKRAEGETFATRKLDEFLDRNAPIKLASRNQLIRQAHRLAEINEFAGITPKGARELKERGAKLIGPKYMTMTVAEQGAIWDAIHSYVAMRGVTSEEAAQIMNSSLNSQGSPVAVAFDYHSDGRVSAYLAPTQSEADTDRYHQRVRMDVLRKKAEENERNGKKPLIGMI